MFVCVSRASQGDAEQLHVVCVCVSDSVPPPPPIPPLSSGLTVSPPPHSPAIKATDQMTNTHTHTHTHTHTCTHTRTHSLQILPLLCLGVRGARCEVAHAHACVPQTGVCVSFLHFMCVCSFVFVGFLCLFLYLSIPAYCT